MCLRFTVLGGGQLTGGICSVSTALTPEEILLSYPSSQTMRSVKGVLSAWLPDRQPTWIDLIVGISAVCWVIVRTQRTSLSWSWVAIGFVAYLTSAGPVANSAIGHSVGRWFRSIGFAGRATVIGLFAISVWAVDSAFDVPKQPVTSFVGGMMCGIALSIVLYLSMIGRPKGWGVA